MTTTESRPAADRRVDVLVISGSMGSGKTTVLGEISDLLKADQIPHAAIDLDWLAEGWTTPGTAGDLMFENLAAVWTNYAAAGVSRAVITEPIESAATLRGIERAIPGAHIVICRLRAQISTMEHRVRMREPGMLQESYAARVAELELILDRTMLEHFSVDNDHRPVTDVAHEILTRAGWSIPKSIGRRQPRRR